MALVKWEPRGTRLTPFQGLRGEVDRIFDDFFRGWPRPWPARWPADALEAFSPAVNVKETDAEIVVTAEVPGFTKEKLGVTVTEDSVTLKGDHEEETERKEQGYFLREASRGSFQRVIPLPAAVVPEQAAAKLENGVLVLTLPKASPAQSKGVKVEVS